MIRFWSKVDKSGECWLWTGCRDRRGYGRFRFRGRTSLAHRVSWTLTHGQPSDDLFVLHRCDTPSCVNPDHLFMGTQTDNMRDCSSKGRTSRHASSLHGNNNGNSRFTPEQVRQMRTMHSNGHSRVDISKRFGASKTSVAYIVTRRYWRHFP